MVILKSLKIKNKKAGSDPLNWV